MGTLLAAIALVVGFLLFWLGIKKVRTNSYAWAVVSFLDVAVLVTATVMLRWIGLTLFILVNALALVVTCIRLAARKEELLVYAATQFDIDKAVAYQLNNEVAGSHRIWRYIGPINVPSSSRRRPSADARPRKPSTCSPPSHCSG